MTVLVYLNTVAQGGATYFPNIKLEVQPRQGTALVFFPATVEGVLDRQVLHAAMPAVDTKYVSQIWIRQSSYFGQASKRLSQSMGPSLVLPHEMKTPIPLSSIGSIPKTITSSSNYHSDGDGQPMSP